MWVDLKINCLKEVVMTQFMFGSESFKMRKKNFARIFDITRLQNLK